MTHLAIHDLGLTDYSSARELQSKMAAQVASGSQPDTLLLLEHPHTFTFGRRGQASNLLWDEHELARRGVAVHWVDRGGDVTYHGPGQLVGYPIIKLADNDHVGYIRKLERALILALARMGLAAHQMAGMSGVWIQAKAKAAKIAAIGVKVDANNVTRHGFALNVAPQMDYFDGIIPCGLHDHPVISMAALLGQSPPMSEVKNQVARAFAETFDFFC